MSGKYLSFTFPPSIEEMLADSSTIKICTGASLANLFIPNPAVALPILNDNSRSVITTNLHGCALHAEGAMRAASNIRSNLSASTGRSLSYARSLWRESANSRKLLYSIIITNLRLLVLNHPADIFSYDIELNIHHTAYRECMEVGMFVGIRNYRHLKSIIRRIANREADAVYRHRSFVHGNVAALRHFFVERDRKSTRLNSSHANISYAVFCLKKKINTKPIFYYNAQLTS